VSKLLALQGAQLWNHGDLQPEGIPEDGEMWSTVQHEPPVPTLDLDQLRMLKAELRALVPAFPSSHSRNSKCLPAGPDNC